MITGKDLSAFGDELQEVFGRMQRMLEKSEVMNLTLEQVLQSEEDEAFNASLLFSAALALRGIISQLK